MSLLPSGTRSGVQPPLLPSCTLSGASAEVDGVGKFLLEDGAVSVLARSSSHTSSYSLESRRTMMLSSSGGPRRLRLRSSMYQERYHPVRYQERYPPPLRIDPPPVTPQRALRAHTFRATTTEMSPPTCGYVGRGNPTGNIYV
jgi:hypothetical protein